MAKLPEEFLKKVTRALEEEETDVYALTLYFLSKKDLEYFPPKDRKRVKRILSALLADTRHHADLLKLIVELGGR